MRESAAVAGAAGSTELSRRVLPARPSAVVSADGRLPRAVIWAYCAPMVPMGFLQIIASLYLMKFSTDVLLIAPGVMGLLYGLGRIWDGASDPLAGYLSDRSQARRGRRRAWMYASAIPVGVGTVMLWSPPPALGSAALVAWMALAFLVSESAQTVFAIPHGALGVELSSDYHERTRLFGYRHVVMAAGMILGVLGFELLRRSEAQRLTAFALSLGGGACFAAAVFYATARLPERQDYRGRGAVRMGKAFLDVLRNPHARLILIVYGVETFGMASVGILAAYVMEYVIDAPGMTVYFILFYFLPHFALTPLWIRLSRRYSKKQLWVASMSLLAVGFGGFFFVAEAPSWLLFGMAFVIGCGNGCGNVVAPSIKADVVDYDEYLTGERKEGAYLAVWNFVRKAAAGVTAMLTGFVLQAVGFEPNAEQSEATKTAMLALFGLTPGAGYLIGMLLFLRFRFNEAEHARVRAVLDARRDALQAGARRTDEPH